MYVYTHATLDDETYQKTGFSSAEKFFVFIRGLYVISSLPIFCQKINVNFSQISDPPRISAG